MSSIAVCSWLSENKSPPRVKSTYAQQLVNSYFRFCRNSGLRTNCNGYACREHSGYAMGIGKCDSAKVSNMISDSELERRINLTLAHGEGVTKADMSYFG